MALGLKETIDKIMHISYEQESDCTVETTATRITCHVFFTSPYFLNT
ncbi:MAG: hypothetical protein WAW23_04150 [Candidatus Methanoperedens sp.]